ncbi:hypothetical protein LCGC14_2352630 [marine sediment metagenome]|uniref:Uncharacterized protein n=1 Tax=marine sediment metagenome TaxID=412755 RepID=A0A0F9ELF7_9ZZZZ
MTYDCGLDESCLDEYGMVKSGVHPLHESTEMKGTEMRQEHDADCPDKDTCLCPPGIPDMLYVAVRCTLYIGDWRVEAIDHDGEGECYVTVFSGPSAQARAEEYADFKNSAVKAQCS